MTWKQVPNMTEDMLRILRLSDGSGRLFMVGVLYLIHRIYYYGSMDGPKTDRRTLTKLDWLHIKYNRILFLSKNLILLDSDLLTLSDFFAYRTKLIFLRIIISKKSW